MAAAFAELAVERMSVSDGGLRTGVLYDLLGRTRHEDMRDTTVREFIQRYGVDEPQAQRVGQLAAQLWASLETQRGAEGDAGGSEEGMENMLWWAAQLHEIGLSISHNGYHKHSAYILSNADMPGFSKKEQATLAMLVLGHTGKLAKMKDYLEAGEDWRPLVCLRLAAVIFRSRVDTLAPKLLLRNEKWRLMMEVPGKWLEANPLTEYDLRQEVDELAKFGIALELSTGPGT
jgi:exopolyphosphatase/guanosine-5'-triphosphate,3'-diphosphate pyrophosphatase